MASRPILVGNSGCGGPAVPTRTADLGPKKLVRCTAFLKLIKFEVLTSEDFVDLASK